MKLLQAAVVMWALTICFPCPVCSQAVSFSSRLFILGTFNACPPPPAFPQMIFNVSVSASVFHGAWGRGCQAGAELGVLVTPRQVPKAERREPVPGVHWEHWARDCGGCYSMAFV